eukprot:scaffold106613_cov61-Phaeocystis_antarctica.AAC.2
MVVGNSQRERVEGVHHRKHFQHRRVGTSSTWARRQGCTKAKTWRSPKAPSRAAAASRGLILLQEWKWCCLRLAMTEMLHSRRPPPSDSGAPSTTNSASGPSSFSETTSPRARSACEQSSPRAGSRTPIATRELASFNGLSSVCFASRSASAPATEFTTASARCASTAAAALAATSRSASWSVCSRGCKSLASTTAFSAVEATASVEGDSVGGATAAVADASSSGGSEVGGGSCLCTLRCTIQQQSRYPRRSSRSWPSTSARLQICSKVSVGRPDIASTGPASALPRRSVPGPCEAHASANI